MTVDSPYADLIEKMSPVCAVAVDSYEVAAVLEADGITDVAAQERYSARDVFDLADRLFRLRPRVRQADRPAPDPWQATPVTHVLRGVLFALPALAYLAVADRIAGPRPTALLVVSVLLSWTVGQGLAHLGYARLGRADQRAAAVLGGAALIVGLPAVTVVAALGIALGVSLTVTLIAAGQVAYVLAATVALVLGREWWLLAALVPGVGAGIGRLVAGPDAGPSGLLAAAAALSVAAAIVVAGWQHLRGVRPQLPSRVDVAAASPNAAFGAVVGALLIFTPVARALDATPDPRIGVGTALAMVLPLSVSMGVAEWLLFRYRSAARRAMAEARTLQAFGRRASTALSGVTTAYLAVLVTIFLAGIGLTALLTGVLPAAWPVAAAVLTGVALFLALLLMSFHLRGPAVLACLAALAASLLLAPFAPPETIQAVTAAGLLIGLYAYAHVTLRRAQLHL
ncbi:hypothetical protein ACWT_0237 [Actinoplanes sp. SE50]|uniref:hypothetical protein n=1 Tax=unclassified Actinoplanes TaxID=2626549 RepID=UPI00023EBC91|nr:MULTISPECIES: hypothetical protein [unclassified Actinoplanes]AEV81249.1 hypothetical protein ACPL_352 [Actinoplanes sp. SE50/110]ATO79652.1 hypothetical protein ACWT_0237 [Actinoplanes sp. SE50]SLL97055.1 hypothetical protein ACSP50_0251 [Actinoplanes sp. SE50/110]